MLYSIFVKAIMLFFLAMHPAWLFSFEEDFILLNGETNEIIVERGSSVDEQTSPCCTFNIVLSLMGYDAAILKDDQTPIWDFQAGYDNERTIWRAPHSPKSWMRHSCVWYSKLLALQLGVEKIQSYLDLMHYGNRDLSGALDSVGQHVIVWLNSSLKISPKEQAAFIKKMLCGDLPLASRSIAMTKSLLFKEETSEQWKLFGKTGWSGSILAKDGETLEHRWFVGWVEKERSFYPFAYLLRDKNIDLDQTIPRVKRLLCECGAFF